MQGEIPPFYEYKIIHKDGSERWLNQRNFLVRDERGSAIAIEGIVSDVTVSKIEEEKYRLVAETITDCITLVGEHGIITYVVNSLEMFGYNSEELIGTNGLDITHPDDLERIRRIYLEAFEKDWGDITFDMRVRHKNGNYVPMEIRARTLTDPQGKVIGGVFVARDITKRRQTELDSSPVSKLNPADPRLTKREREILNWIMQGKSNWDISIIVNISQSTVSFHVNNLMRKLGAVSRSHAVAIALQEEICS